MSYRTKPVDVEAVQYLGQELPSVERQYLGTDELGQSLYQGIVRFPGGFATIREGDWLVNGIVYTAAEFVTIFEEVVPPPAVPTEAPIADTPATGDGDAI